MYQERNVKSSGIPCRDDREKARNKRAMGVAVGAQSANYPNSRATFVLGAEDHDASIAALKRVAGLVVVELVVPRNLV